MKAPQFNYIHAKSLDHATRLLQEHGEEARIMAGGQSLMATLNMRLSSPGILIDINKITELSGVSTTKKDVAIGALTRHVEILKSETIREHLPLIHKAIPHVAHVAVRNRGTFGGSISMADPAAELPACCVALDASFVLASKTGKRTIKARDFFTGLYSTGRQDNEILTQVIIPKTNDNQVYYFEEINRRHGDFAIVGLACSGKVKKALMSSKRILAELDFVFFGCEDKPTLARQATSVLTGVPLSNALIETAKNELAKDLDPMENLEGRSDTKLHLAQVLLERAITAIAQDAQITFDTSGE